MEDLRKATTPMYTSLICLVNRLFTAPGELEIAINAAFENPKLRRHDIIFHNQITTWSDMLIRSDSLGYNQKHK